jgi:hypothetical protein
MCGSRDEDAAGVRGGEHERARGHHDGPVVGEHARQLESNDGAEDDRQVEDRDLTVEQVVCFAAEPAEEQHARRDDGQPQRHPAQAPDAQDALHFVLLAGVERATQHLRDVHHRGWIGHDRAQLLAHDGVHRGHQVAAGQRVPRGFPIAFLITPRIHNYIYYGLRGPLDSPVGTNVRRMLNPPCR